MSPVRVEDQLIVSPALSTVTGEHSSYAAAGGRGKKKKKCLCIRVTHLKKHVHVLTK